MPAKYHLSAFSMLMILASAYASVNFGDISSICTRIEASVSNKSEVFYPDGLTYKKDISHFSQSSSQTGECSVEPGTPEDIGIILDILGSTKTPFSVKGGGHSSNPGFSSSPGIQIALYRFSEVTYSAASQSVVVGSGLVWDDVYAALDPDNVTVIGGRVPGVGVAGLALGGGYSFKTNQYGLTLDTILAYELVKPDGQVVTVTEQSDSELFFALRGGLNNFGIVTRFTLRTFPQGKVWGGSIGFNASQASAVSSATVNYTALVTDPKASAITLYSFISGQLHPAVFMFYDDPTPPPGIFDEFLEIPSLINDAKTQDYPSLFRSAVIPNQPKQRWITNTVSLSAHTPKLLDAIVNETVFWGTHLANGTSPLVLFSVEPFLRSIFSHSSCASAYPPSRSVGYNLLDIQFTWFDEAFDSEGWDAARQSAKHIYDLAIAEGQDIAEAPLYPNYAIFDTPLEKMYGDHNVEKLKKLKAAIDSDGVMDLTGGFRF